MTVIVVANPKGGVGKSTLATQIAGLLAHRGHAVMLGDTDVQQSSRQWLALRPPQLPPIRGWDVGPNETLKTPRGTTHVVLDSPAGVTGRPLEQLLRVSRKMIVPLQPSLFDIQATHTFLNTLAAHKRAGGVDVALVGMRVREHTIALEQLQRYVASLPGDVPMIGWLRETQKYVHLAAHGLTLWDVSPGRVQKDLDQWQPLEEWILR